MIMILIKFLEVYITVVNALSEKLKLEINDGKKYLIEFKNGEAKALKIWTLFLILASIITDNG